MFNRFYAGYPPKDQLVDQFAFGMAAASAVAVIFYVVLRLDYLEMNFESFVFMWCSIYAAMLIGIGIARYRHMFPFESKSAFLVAMISSAVGLMLGIAFLFASGYYSRYAYHDLLDRLMSLLIPGLGAVALGFDIDLPWGKKKMYR